MALNLFKPTAMNVSIIGCKYFNDYQVLKWQLDDLKATQITTCGNGNIEKMAVRYAEETHIKLIELWPEKKTGWIYLWKEYFRLVDSSDLLLAFWYGESNSILCMINKAKKMKKEVVIVRGYQPELKNSLTLAPLQHPAPVLAQRAGSGTFINGSISGEYHADRGKLDS